MDGLHASLESLFPQIQDEGTLLSSEQFAQWTLPTVFTKDITGSGGTRTPLHRDYQSTMAILVNTASTKVVKALFPQGAPFFRFNNSEEMADVVSQLGVDGSVPSVQATIENAASSQVFKEAEYAAKLHATKLLMITGNALEFRDSSKQQSYVYSIRDYAVKRNGTGDVMLIIIRERICVGDLPTEFREANYANKRDYEDVTLYTGVKRKVLDGGNVVYEVHQEVDQKPVGKPSTYPENQCPYTVLVWNRVNGEHYGRGLVEDYAGDIARLSELSKALTLYEVESMKFVNMSSSSSGIDIDEFQNAEIGEYVGTNAPPGANPGAWVYEGGDYQKISVIQNELASLEAKLSRAFMYTGNTRDAERVTAYEIRQNAQEAQEALGDAYATLSSVWLTKLAYLYCLELYPSIKTLLDLGAMSLDIVVGLAALSKAARTDALMQATQALQLIAPVLQQLTKRTNVDALIDTVMDSFGIVTNDFFYNEQQMQAMKEQEDLAAAQEQQQQQAMLSAADPAQAAAQLGLVPGQ